MEEFRSERFCFLYNLPEKMSLNQLVMLVTNAAETRGIEEGRFGFSNADNAYRAEIVETGCSRLLKRGMSAFLLQVMGLP